MSSASYWLLFLRQLSGLSGACSSFHIPGTGSPRGLERKEAHPELDESFDEAMDLLDEGVEGLTLPQFTRVWHGPFSFQFLESFWVGCVFINRNNLRSAGVQGACRQ
jgi:hypothetical protein